MPKTIYAIVCEGEIVFASTEYNDVFDRRESITSTEGGCNEPHPIVSGRFVR